MMKGFRYFAVFMILVLGLVACQLIQQVQKQKVQPDSKVPVSQEGKILTDNTSRTEHANPSETQMPVNDNFDPIEWHKPPQSQAAEIRPEDMRKELTHLSNLIGYEVLDENGDKLGVARDYIVNTCETYILYILMEPVASLNFAPENLVVFPFEAVTINSGVLDAENDAIHLRLISEQFSGAPTLSIGQQLTPTQWEGKVRDFWSKVVHLGVLATSCNVPDGLVYKVAYATQLLSVELYDGQNVLLGVVQEAILEPESGKLAFYIIKPTIGDGFVLVHLRATNIPKEALLPGGVLTLVLLADPKLFWQAPRLTNIAEANDFALQSEMRKYWGE